MWTSLIGIVTDWGVSKKLAGPLIILLGIGFAVALFFGAKAIYDHNIIKTHDLKVEAQQAKDDRKADDAAAVKRRADDARAAQEEKELDNVLTKPASTAAQRRADFYRCISLQRAARANGLEPPTCV
jgi:hypothetical protein